MRRKQKLVGCSEAGKGNLIIYQAERVLSNVNQIDRPGSLQYDEIDSMF